MTLDSESLLVEAENLLNIIQDLLTNLNPESSLTDMKIVLELSLYNLENIKESINNIIKQPVLNHNEKKSESDDVECEDVIHDENDEEDDDNNEYDNKYDYEDEIDFRPEVKKPEKKLKLKRNFQNYKF